MAALLMAGVDGIGNKTASIRDLSEKVLAGDVELDRVAKLSDDEIVQAVRDRVRAWRIDHRSHRFGSRIDLADPGDALVGVHEHHGRVLPGARPRVPGGGERRLEGIAVGTGLDRRDRHQAPP